MISFDQFLAGKDQKLFFETYYFKGKAPIDSDDVDYLKQFNSRHHAQAMAYRYNVALPSAIKKTKHGPVIKDNWQDIKDIPIVVPGRKKIHNRSGVKKKITKEEFIDIWAEMYKSGGSQADIARFFGCSEANISNIAKKLRTRGVNLPALKNIEKNVQIKIYKNIKLNIPILVKKLEQRGFDLLSWEPINKKTIYAIIHHWRKQGGEVYDKMQPNKQKPKTNSFGGSERGLERIKWKKVYTLAHNIAFKNIENFIKALENPNHSQYLNRWYWKRNFENIVEEAVNYIKNNLKVIDIDENLESSIKKLMAAFMRNRVQKGDITRRVKNHIDSKVDKKLFPMLSKTWPKPDPKISGPAWTLGGDKGTQHSALMNLASKIANVPLKDTMGLDSKAGKKLT